MEAGHRRGGRGRGRGQAARGIPPESRNRPDAGGAPDRGRRKKGEEGDRVKNKETRGERKAQSQRKTSTVRLWTGPLLPPGLSLPTWATGIGVEACFLKYNQGTLYIRITWEPLKNADSGTPRRADPDPGPKVGRPGLLINAPVRFGQWPGAQALGIPPGDPRASLNFPGEEPPGRQQVGRQGQLGIPSTRPHPPRGCSCESWELGPGAAPSSLAPVSSPQPQPRAQLQLGPGAAGQADSKCLLSA